MAVAFATFRNLHSSVDAWVCRAPVVKFVNGRELDWVFVDVRVCPAFRVNVHADRVWVRAGDTDMRIDYVDALSGMTTGKYVTWVLNRPGETPDGFGRRMKANFESESAAYLDSTDDCWRAVEYFAGSGHFTSACSDAGASNCHSYDRYVHHKPINGVQNIVGQGFDEMFSDDAHWRILSHGNVLHFSPVCTTFSNLATSTHQRSRANNFLGVTEEAHLANGTLLRIYHILKARSDAGHPAVFSIENPDAAMAYHPVIAAICRELGAAIVTLTFCAFGETVRKPTSFVTNSQTLIGLAEGDTILDNPEFFDDPVEFISTGLKAATQDAPITIQSIYHCANKSGCCSFRRGRHDQITVRSAIATKKRHGASLQMAWGTRGRERVVLKRVGKHTSAVTAFPTALCTFLAACLRTDAIAVKRDRAGASLTQNDRCNTTGCVFFDGHTGPCSHGVGLRVRMM